MGCGPSLVALHAASETVTPGPVPANWELRARPLCRRGRREWTDGRAVAARIDRIARMLDGRVVGEEVLREFPAGDAVASGAAGEG